MAEDVEGLRQDGFRTAPGELGEQLVIAGLAPGALAPGARLRLGASAVIEVIKPRTGCSRFAHIQGRPIKVARGRMGVMARVVCGGAVAVGDAVTLENPAGATSPPA
jgi:MOSC domain-containing protein YiiM